MGKKLDPKDNELYKRTDEVLHYIWDPIGVSGEPFARDEYWAYLPQVFNMVLNDKPKEIIVSYLLTVVKDNMGLNPNRKNTEKVVKILQVYKEKIYKNNP